MPAPDEDPPDRPEHRHLFHHGADYGSVGALEQLRDPAALERLSVEEIVAVMESYGLRRDSQIPMMGWGQLVGKPELATTVHVITRDATAVRLALGPHGTYQFTIIADDVATHDLSATQMKDISQILGIRGTVLELTVGPLIRNAPGFEAWIQWHSGVNVSLREEVTRIRALFPPAPDAAE